MDSRHTGCEDGNDMGNVFNVQIYLIEVTHPMGCPKLTAPPWIFVLFASISRDLRNANTTTLNASFTSHSATSSCFTPHLSSSCKSYIPIRRMPVTSANSLQLLTLPTWLLRWPQEFKYSQPAHMSDKRAPP